MNKAKKEDYAKLNSGIIKFSREDLTKYFNKYIQEIIIKKWDGNKKLEEIVRIVKSKDYELDFNVSGYRKPYCDEAYIDGYLLKLVRDYSVKTIFGSDSHTHDTVGYKMKEYNRLMEELQF